LGLLNIFCLAASYFITFYVSSFYVRAILGQKSFLFDLHVRLAPAVCPGSAAGCWFVVPVGMQTVPGETGEVTGFLLGGIDVLVAYN